MTEFRTKGKGKDRQVYPVNRKKPFGISRELAFRDVEKLRADGDRARLVRTNRRLDLYAPYVAVIKQASDEARSIGEPIKAEDSGDHGPSIADFDAVRRMKAAENKFDMMPPTILNEDGESMLASVDQGHVMAAWIALPFRVNTAEVEEFNGKRRALRIPALDYSKDSTEILMDRREVSGIRSMVNDLLREIKADSTTPYHRKSRFSASDISILFTKADSGKQGYAVVMLSDSYKTPDESKHYTRAMKVDMGNMPSGEMAKYSPQYFLDSFRLFNELEGSNANGKHPYRISLKPDYPLLISRESPEGKRITQLKEGVILAPMLTDDRDRERARDAIGRFNSGSDAREGETS